MKNNLEAVYIKTKCLRLFYYEVGTNKKVATKMLV